MLNKIQDWYIRVMLVFEAGSNNIILTLNEAKSLDTPEYVLILKEDHRGTQVACKLGTDLSDYPERFNEFTVTVNDSPDPLLAQISLGDKSHHYWVYEMADADSFDFEGVNGLDLDTMTGEVENGKAVYNTEAEERDHYADTTQSRESYGN